jgi:L-histidine N-alpha-methyltransferase
MSALSEPKVRRVRDEREDLALMAREVCEGLASTRPSLPCKYFYDDRGSDLFERITTLPEYYQTRTEERILEAAAAEVVRRVRPLELLELGSGSGRKVRLLLDAMAREGRLHRCLLLDVNERALCDSLRRLSVDYPGVEMEGVVGDFLRDLGAIGEGEERLVAFFAGTIGNIHPGDVPGFLRSLSARLKAGDGFLLGVDLVKDSRRLEAAYNDAAGVTAEFNLNILRAVNERLGGDFDLSAFEHVAFYDQQSAWIEMRLRAARETTVRVAACGLERRFRKGDEIRTEISCKYTRRSLESKLGGTGLRLERWLSDPEQLFALALLVRE